MADDWIDTVFQGSAEDMASIPDESVQTCVTSPPYWGLRDYGIDGQLGLEVTPEEYIEKMVGIFREVRRVLRDDGTLWLNLGDSYAANRGHQVTDTMGRDVGNTKGSTVPPGLKPKDLVGIPWRVAFALRADGWWLRSDIIWSKPNPMPGSYKDRPTSSHEYIFLLSKAEHYYYDSEAIAEPATYQRWPGIGKATADQRISVEGRDRVGPLDVKLTRNKRDVWIVPTKPFAGAHFAVYPERLITPCVLAGSRPGDTVLDPFMGSGTTALVALRHRRHFTGYELNPDYHKLIDERIAPFKGQARLPVETPPPPGFGWGEVGTEPAR